MAVTDPENMPPCAPTGTAVCRNQCDDHATVARLLTEGGDTRIILEPGQSTNKYGCPPTPDNDLLAFGSSTASVISEAGFAAANRLYQRIRRAPGPASAIYARELDRIRQDLLRLCEVDDMPGLDTVFAASGTDLHLICAQLAAGAASQPALVVLMAPEETGRGVPAAMAGRHFGSRSPLGGAVPEGALLDGCSAVDTVSVPIRTDDGMPRPAAQINAEVEALVMRAIAAGRRVLLTLVDVSKTGMIAPSPACAAALRRRAPDYVEVLVDACQFRLAPASLRAYLEHDFMVALTGSKFLTGPTFSGVLLVPGRVARHLRARPLPRALTAYSSAADWPSGWIGANNLDAVPNFGLLLRWEAALEELRAFRAVSTQDITDFLHEFARAIRNRLHNDPRFEPLLVPALAPQRIDSSCWDSIPTIFPFLLCHQDADNGRRFLDRDDTAQVYQLLQMHGTPEKSLCINSEDTAAWRCQLGQPVVCGVRDGIPVSALRLCTSARLVVNAISNDRRTTIIQQALDALDKTALLAAGIQTQVAT